MAFDPSLSTPTDRARLRLGDFADPPVIPEASYAAVLNSGVSYNEALAQLAEALGSYYLKSSETQVNLGDQMYKVSANKAKYYFDLAKSLRTDYVAPSDGSSGAGIGQLSDPCFGNLDYSPHDPCINDSGWTGGSCRLP